MDAELNDMLASEFWMHNTKSIYRSILACMMTGSNFFFNPTPYIPSTLDEIYDKLGSMVLRAPTFRDHTGTFRLRNIDSEFDKITQGFARVREKVGEERYARLIDFTNRAKELFAADQDDTNGKTDQGRAFLYKIEDEIYAVWATAQSSDDDDPGNV